MASYAEVICHRCKHLTAKCTCAKMYLIAFEDPDVDGSNAASGNTAPEWFNRVLARMGAKRGVSNSPLPSVHVPDTIYEKLTSKISGKFYSELLSEGYTKLYIAAMALHGSLHDSNGSGEVRVYYLPIPAGYNSPLYVALEMRWSAAGDARDIMYRISGASMPSKSGGFTVDTTIIRAYSFSKTRDAFALAKLIGVPFNFMVFPKRMAASNGSVLHLALIDRLGSTLVISDAPEEILSSEPSSENPVVPGPKPENVGHMSTYYRAALSLHEYLNSIDKLRRRLLDHPKPQPTFDYRRYVAFEVRRQSHTVTVMPHSVSNASSVCDLEELPEDPEAADSPLIAADSVVLPPELFEFHNNIGES